MLVRLVEDPDGIRPELRRLRVGRLLLCQGEWQLLALLSHTDHGRLELLLPEQQLTVPKAMVVKRIRESSPAVLVVVADFIWSPLRQLRHGNALFGNLLHAALAGQHVCDGERHHCVPSTLGSQGAHSGESSVVKLFWLWFSILFVVPRTMPLLVDRYCLALSAQRAEDLGRLGLHRASLRGSVRRRR